MTWQWINTIQNDRVQRVIYVVKQNWLLKSFILFLIFRILNIQEYSRANNIFFKPIFVFTSTLYKVRMLTKLLKKYQYLYKNNNYY